MEESYIQIGEHRYPVTFQRAIQSQEPVAHFEQVWTRWRKHKPVSLTVQAKLTEHGKAIMQEYLASGQCMFSIGYTVHPHITVASRYYHRRPRNSRIQRVQAKRKAMDLSQDGKCCGLRTRRASLAYRQAEQAWYDDRRSEQPYTREFEHVPMRRRRKQAKHDKALARILRKMNEAEFADWMHEQYVNLANVFAISAQELGEMSDVNHLYS